MSKHEVIVAFEAYRVGQIIEPTGVWADELRRRGYIRKIEEVKQPETIQPRRKKHADRV